MQTGLPRLVSLSLCSALALGCIQFNSRNMQEPDPADESFRVETGNNDYYLDKLCRH